MRSLLRSYLDSLVPPSWKIFVGGNARDFRQIGEKWVEIFKLAGLKPHHRVLDVGCGIGRMAIPLSTYLTGSYEGFDTVKSGIDWCNRKIARKHANFRFRHVDIYNPRYNRRGVKAAEFTFPYGTEFDFAFLTSVFTHMREAEVDHYLAELARVLKPGGICLATFFLLNDTSLKTMSGDRNFVHPVGPLRTTDPKCPEAAIAYPEDMVRELYEKNGLEISAVHYGEWSGRAAEAGFPRHAQDVVIATRPPSAA